MFEGFELQIRVKGAEIEVLRRFGQGNVHFESSSTYFADKRGEENLITYPVGPRFFSRSKTVASGRKLTVRYESITPVSQIFGVYTYTLSGDGDTLLIKQRNKNTPFGMVSYFQYDLTLRRRVI
jgi:hypothetical protein